MKLYERKGKNGSVIWVDCTVNGKRIRKSLGLAYNKTNLAYVQRNIIPELLEQIERGIFGVTITLKELCFEELKAKELKKSTFLRKQADLERIFKILPNKDVRLYSIGDIEDFILEQQRKGFAGGSIKIKLACLNYGFDRALRREIIPKNPCKLALKPKCVTKKKLPFTIFEMHRILNEAQGYLKTFCYLAFYTGARPNEVLALKWSDIDDMYVHIKRTHTAAGLQTPKTGESRKVFLLEPLKKYLDTLPKTDGFIIKKQYASMSYQWRTLFKRLDIPYRSAHTTRHTYTSILLNARVTPTLIQKELGHANLTMINQVYGHFLENANVNLEELNKAFLG